MPILSAEPELFPDALFDDPPDAGGWLVAHTKPRQEKCLARRLVAAGLGFYLPCADRRTVVRGRLLTSRVPLFAGYVFVRGTAADRGWVLGTGRVAAVVPVPDSDRLWADLRQVRRLLASGRPVFPEDRVEPGATVRVRTGPLAGLTGTVARHAGGRRFVVRVEFIGRGVAVELDDRALARVSPVRPLAPIPAPAPTVGSPEGTV
jgi:transcriptional antiterminator RfaH